MDVYKLKTLSVEDRLSVLRGESLKVEVQSYMQPLSPEELAIKKDEFTNAAILKAATENDLAEVKKEFKDKLDPLRSKISECLTAIKNKAIEVTGDVYMMDDHENQMIHFVDPNGNVLSSRRMLPEEKQTRIMTPLKEANS
jgi:predicted GNAT superfamily acetyltransferase